MEPLDALLLADGMVRFVDFVLNLIAKSGGLYLSSSGQTVERVDLSTIKSDLSDLMSSVGINIRAIPRQATRTPTEGSWDQSFIDLYVKCTVIAKSLEDCMHKMDEVSHSFHFGPAPTTNAHFRPHKNGENVHQSTHSFVDYIQSCSQFNAVQCKESLLNLRQLIMSTSVKVIWEKSPKGVRQLGDISTNEAEVVKSLGKLEMDSQALDQSLVNALDCEMTRQNPLRTNFVNRIWSSEDFSETLENLERAEDGAHRFPALERGELSGLSAKVKAAAKPEVQSYATAIMNSLKFQAATQRKEAIQKACSETLQWIFAGRSHPISDAEPGWRFTTWLKGPEKDVYWITGKPGAGKSTLVKFLADNVKTRSYLETWASGKPLIQICHYFWGAGVSQLQKSPVGLLRTLLLQCLQQMPSLCPRLCPRRWALFKIFGTRAEDLNLPWTWAELLEAFSILAAIAGTELYLSLLIDGLDEFDGDQKSLVEFIKLFHRRPGIKILVSSRPENIFLGAFGEGPSLRMEEFTAKDIEMYVRQKLDEVPAYKDIQKVKSAIAIKLEKGVVEKAQGVFLWVTIVVQALCQGLREGDKMSQLQSLLDSLPTDLSELYSKLWEKIRDSYKEDSSQIFQIHNISTTPLNVVVLHFAEISIEEGIEESARGIDENDRAYIMGSVTRRVNSRTRGLLEVSKSGEIDFLHRSVREWANARWDVICKDSSPDFDSHLAILKGLSLEIKSPLIWKSEIRQNFWLRASLCLFHASKVQDNSVNGRELESVMDRLDINLNELFISLQNSQDRIPVYLQIHNMANSGQPLPHWSTAQYTITSDTLENSFLGLAAQFGVMPYVRKKVLDNSKALIEPNPIHLPILSCAVFGFRYFCREDVFNWTKRYLKPTSFDTRFQLVEFLVQTGALVALKMTYKQNRSNSSQLQMYQLHWNTEDDLQRKLQRLESMPNVNNEELQYYKRVMALFDMYKNEEEDEDKREKEDTQQKKSRSFGTRFKELFRKKTKS